MTAKGHVFQGPKFVDNFSTDTYFQEPQTRTFRNRDTYIQEPLYIKGNCLTGVVNPARAVLV